MKDKRILFNTDQGELAIVIPAPDSGLTLEKVIEKCVPKGKSYKVIDISDMPIDWTFRDAWEDTELSGNVQVNMDKARTIHMDRIRYYRDQRLVELDAEQMKRISMDQDWHDIKVEKQRLRDIPQTFDLSLITDPYSLARAIPEGIGMPSPSEG